jgi:hypothetical protein
VPLVDLQPERGQLGQHLVGQPGVDQQLQAGPREAAEQQLGQLVEIRSTLTMSSRSAIARIASTTSARR